MRSYRIALVILAVIAVMYVPTLLIGPLQLLHHGKSIPLAGIGIILGFTLPLIALPFLWNVRKIGLGILLSSTFLVFFSALLAPRHTSPSILDRFIYAFSFSIIHIILSLISLGTYTQRHGNTAEQDAAANP